MAWHEYSKSGCSGYLCCHGLMLVRCLGQRSNFWSLKKKGEIDNVEIKIRYDKRLVGDVLKGYLHFKKSSPVSGLGRVER